MSKHASESLTCQEQMSVTLVIATLTFFTCLAYLNTPYPQATSQTTPHYIKDLHIEVTVDGAVAYPGTYIVTKGSTVGTLLEKVKPLPDADLRKVNPSTKLRSAKKWTIRTLNSPKAKKALHISQEGNKKKIIKEPEFPL